MTKLVFIIQWHLYSFEGLIHIDAVLFNDYLHHILWSVSVLERIGALVILLVDYKVASLLAVLLIHVRGVRDIVCAEVIRGRVHILRDVLIAVLQLAIWKFRFEYSIIDA